MARIFSTGFELNSLATNVEFDSNSGFIIQTATVRSGTYTAQANVVASTSTVRQVLFTSNQSIAGWFRIYINIASLPNANVQLMRFETTANTNCGNLRLNTDGTIGLFRSSGAQLGSFSIALTTGTWYRIEIGIDATGSGTLEARINGLTFASGANSVAGAWARVAFGAFGANATYNIFYDDVAVNDSSGSSQNTWPGDGKLVHLKPNTAGDVNSFSVAVGGTAGASNNYTRVQEVTPDDLTTYNGSTTLSQEDLFNVDDSGIASNSIVKFVAVGARFADIAGADAIAAFKLELIKTSAGTKLQSGAIIPNTSTWRTNALVTPWTYPITTYVDPDGSPWSQTTLDSMQIGYTLTAANTRTVAISSIWALVEYTGPMVSSGSFLQLF